MNERHLFIVSLEEFFEKEKYTEEQQGHFIENFSDLDALVTTDGKKYVLLPPYMNYILEGLELGKNEAQEKHSLKSILDYDYVCRCTLKEWLAFSAAILRNFALDPDIFPEEDERQGLSELVDGLKQIAEHFIEAQKMLLSPPTLHGSQDKSSLAKDNS